MTTVLAPLMHTLTPNSSPSSSPRQSHQQSPQPTSHPKAKKRPRHVAEAGPTIEMDRLLAELRASFAAPLTLHTLAKCSRRLQDEYRAALKASDISMLPSYNHTLPTGKEQGRLLALDVGGSTFRVAVVELVGRHAGPEYIRMLDLYTYVIDARVKSLRGPTFFDWMAERIDVTLHACKSKGILSTGTIPMGLAWSFPVEQTSARSGKLLAMGKKFLAAEGVEDQDLGEVIMRSCLARGLDVQMRAIVNDGAATLLSQAYRDPAARVSLIVGTGMNSAALMPTSLLSPAKFGDRTREWQATAKQVVVNTELSMFGQNIMPRTRFDDMLNSRHDLPGFQPMEYMCGGLYLAELVRLVMVEAIETAGLFGGELPAGLNKPYELKAHVLAALESDATPDVMLAKTVLFEQHPLPATTVASASDMLFLQEVARLVSQRAQAYLATSIHALWSLLPRDQTDHLTVACNGGIIEKYPEFRQGCQSTLDGLCVDSGYPAGTAVLEMAPESSLFGAAVAVAYITDL